MAKRFTDTEKWKKPFVRGLQTPYKMLWMFMLDECDHAGIFIPDWDIIEIYLGHRFERENVLETFGSNVIDLENGYWFIPDFITFQYGQLNKKNRVHASVINRLNQFDIDIDIKPLRSPLEGLKDKYMEKEKDLDKDKEKDNGVPEKINWENLVSFEVEPEIQELWLKYERQRITDGMSAYNDGNRIKAIENLYKSAGFDIEKVKHGLNVSISGGRDGAFAKPLYYNAGTKQNEPTTKGWRSDK